MNAAVLPMDLLEQHPTLEAGFLYWLSLGKGRLPAFGDLDPFAFAEHGRNAILTASLMGGQDFEYLMIGDEVRPYLHADYTGMRLQRIFDKSPGSAIWHVYRKVVVDKVPYVASLEYVGPRPNIRSTREIYLPFRDGESDEVAQILVLILFTEQPVLSLRPEPWRRGSATLPYIRRVPVPC